MLDSLGIKCYFKLGINLRGYVVWKGKTNIFWGIEEVDLNWLTKNNLEWMEAE